MAEAWNVVYLHLEMREKGEQTSTRHDTREAALQTGCDLLRQGHEVLRLERNGKPADDAEAIKAWCKNQRRRD